MAADASRSLEEFQAAVEEIKQRVASRRTRSPAPGFSVPIVDLNPLLHARDAAESKVAAIGTVNPRPPGLANSIIQFVKRKAARALDWYVRDQVLFNQGMIQCVQATMSALNESNHIMLSIGKRMDDLDVRLQQRVGDTDALKRDFDDLRSGWAQWRQGFETRQADTELHFLRSLAEMQNAYQHRLTLTEQSVHKSARDAVDLVGQSARESVRLQHTQFQEALDRAREEIQERMWKELAATRELQERTIHHELRLVRRRAGTVSPGAQAPAPLTETMDYGAFAERFRGPEEYVRRSQNVYLGEFRNCRRVVDLGCGRGEFLESMREAGISAVGVETSPELVALCQSKGLEAESADLFSYLGQLPEGSIDGILCSQVVEHLPAQRVPELVRLASTALAPGGVIVIETPNPECLAIFATHFYLDPTHTRPVPSALLAFYLEENGFSAIDIRLLSPALESFPEIDSLPADFREKFFGALDYAIVARKL